METRLRTALIAWLGDDPSLAEALNAIHEEAPLAATPPWLGLVASASTDWSTKDRKGREVRIALELHLLAEGAAQAGALAEQIEQRISALPAQQDGFRVVSSTFLRARAEARARHRRALMLEYRFRLLED